MSETRYCSECKRKTESGKSYGRPYCRECGSFHEPKLLEKRKEMIAELREWHEGKKDSFPPFTVFEAVGVMLDELDRLEREYAEERAAHNAHVTELCELEKENRKMREELDAVAEGYRQQVKLAGELMDKLVFAQKREQRLIKKLREITKALGGVTFTDGRQWGAYNALCDILEENEKELSE
mgnify:CR=1 FL=1